MRTDDLQQEGHAAAHEISQDRARVEVVLRAVQLRDGLRESTEAPRADPLPRASIPVRTLRLPWLAERACAASHENPAPDLRGEEKQERAGNGGLGLQRQLNCGQAAGQVRLQQPGEDLRLQPLFYEVFQVD